MIYIILTLIVLAMIGVVQTFREIKILRTEIDQLKSMKEVRADEHAADRAEDRANKIADDLTAANKLL
jgi:hypothetical protein